MKKTKKIETNILNSLFATYKIKNEQMVNLLGGVEIRITVKCTSGETLIRADHLEKCSAADTTLNVGCNAGANLCAVISPVSIRENSYISTNITVTTIV
ncbi:MAG: hypothetical protein LBV02_08155 [Bacteroidales bacterium]|jgi:hypothetical protein|nr:hypothetical protein [Bacteroidales bacterium]